MVICGKHKVVQFWGNFELRFGKEGAGRLGRWEAFRVDCLKSGLAIGRVSERITLQRNPGGRDPTTAACHP